MSFYCRYNPAGTGTPRSVRETFSFLRNIVISLESLALQQAFSAIQVAYFYVLKASFCFLSGLIDIFMFPLMRLRRKICGTRLKCLYLRFI